MDKKVKIPKTVMFAGERYKVHPHEVCPDNHHWNVRIPHTWITVSLHRHVNDGHQFTGSVHNARVSTPLMNSFEKVVEDIERGLLVRFKELADRRVPLTQFVRKRGE